MLSSAWLLMPFLRGSVTLGCPLSNRMVLISYLFVVLFYAITGLLFPKLTDDKSTTSGGIAGITITTIGQITLGFASRNCWDTCRSLQVEDLRFLQHLRGLYPSSYDKYDISISPSNCRPDMNPSGTVIPRKNQTNTVEGWNQSKFNVTLGGQTTHTYHSNETNG